MEPTAKIAQESYDTNSLASNRSITNEFFTYFAKLGIRNAHNFMFENISIIDEMRLKNFILTDYQMESVTIN